MCEHHHSAADAGAFSIDQLRQLKTHAREARPIRGAFDWRREQLVVRAGGITAIGCPVLLRFGDRDAIWLSTDDEGNQLLNLDVWAHNGSLLFSMRDNDWIVLTELDDLECPPAGKSLILKAPSAGVVLELRFSAFTRDQLRERFRQDGLASAHESAKRYAQLIEDLEQRGAPAEFLASMRDRPTPEQEAAAHAHSLMNAVADQIDACEIIVCDLSGDFVYPYPLRLTQNDMILPGNNVISQSTVIGGGVAVQIG